MKRTNKKQRRKSVTRGAFGQAKILRTARLPGGHREWVHTRDGEELRIDGLPVWGFSKGFFDPPDDGKGSSAD